MTSQTRHIHKVSNAACRACDRTNVTVLTTARGDLYCLPCLRERHPNIFEAVQNWVDAHRIPELDKPPREG